MWGALTWAVARAEDMMPDSSTIITTGVPMGPGTVAGAGSTSALAARAANCSGDCGGAPMTWIEARTEKGGFFVSVPERDKKLVAASEICQDHLHFDAGRQDFIYEKRWNDSCFKLAKEWQESGAAQRADEVDRRKVQEEKAFVDSVAEGK